MIILVNSGSGGLANYLINGTKNNRDKEKIEILDGDLKLTEDISNSLNYKDKHYHMILSVDGKYDNKQMSEIYQDFKKELLNSYSDDEVNISAVLHQDTNNSHIHCMIPKKNLLTNTKLDLYFDKRDRKRFELIRDFIDTKHGLKSPNNKEQSSNTKLEKNIKNWIQDSSHIKTKKQKLEFENKLMTHIDNNIDEFKSHNELMNYLQTKINILKCGYDYKNNKYYATVEHTSGTKQRIFSELFNDGKSKYTTDVNGVKVYENNNNFNQLSVEDFEFADFSSSKLQQLREKLDIENEKYSKYIDSRIGNSRKKAREKLAKLTEESTPKIKNMKLEKSKEINSSFLSKNKELFEDLEKINKSDISKIATKFFNFNELKKDNNHSIIHNPKNNDTFIVYKDEEENYNYINPYTKASAQGVNFLVKSLGVPFLNNKILKPFIDFIKDINSIMDVIFSNILDSIIDSFLSKSINSNNYATISKDKKYNKSLSFPNIELGRDRELKPF